MLFKLEKPNIKHIDQKDIIAFLQLEKESEGGGIITKSFYPKYLHWDKVKHQELPGGYTSEMAWAAIKFMRNTVLRKQNSVIIDEKGNNFSWLTALPLYDEFLHDVGMNLGGTLLGLSRDLDDTEKQRILTRGIMEEAIASSQLEGADTTRKVAKQMLREGRKPRTEGEQMITNNYRTMQYIEDTLKSEPLSLDMLKELHIMLTKDTLESPKDEGRLRTEEDKGEDEIVIKDRINGTIYHIAPDEAFMREELTRLVAYANDDLEDVGFVHPVFKAIMLHFWIGYLHPFVDGNGRLARTLFYWYLLKHNYWGFAYLPLSKVIKKSPEQYKMAYVYTEQDDNDLTYFIDYNVRKIKQAMTEFQEYEKSIIKENTKMVKKARQEYNLNDRQIQVLQYYQKNKDEGVSVPGHTNINKISRATAITDLKKLEQLNFVSKKKIGRKVYYYATKKIEELFS